MALRARSDPAPAARSAKVGDRVAFTVKLENTGATDEGVALYVEGLNEGALNRPVELPVTLEPASATVPAKKRSELTFHWTAALPEGKDAFTLRGRLVLKRALDGKLVASGPLDLYVSR